MARVLASGAVEGGDLAEVEMCLARVLAYESVEGGDLVVTHVSGRHAGVCGRMQEQLLEVP